MHELSLMQRILDASLDEAKKAGDKRIKRIYARVRESGHPMDAQSLQELLKTIAKGTAAEEAEMEIGLVPPQLRCRECGNTFSSQGSTLLCPHCRSGRLEEVDAEEIDLECSFVE